MKFELFAQRASYWNTIRRNNNDMEIENEKESRVKESVCVCLPDASTSRSHIFWLFHPSKMQTVDGDIFPHLKR